MTAHAEADEKEAWSAGTQPSGVMATCKEVARDAKTFTLSWGDGAFRVVLPVASDWKLQCDRERVLWGLSPSQRLQVSLNPYLLRSGDDATPQRYLAAIGENMKQGMEKQGVRVSRVSVSPLARGGLALEMSLDAPVGRKLPLFPQDTFITTREGPASGGMMDLHFSTYWRSAKEQAALRAKVRDLMSRFSVLSPGEDAKLLPSFAGVSAEQFSSKSVSSLKSVLDCQSAQTAFYCDALDRFAAAKPLANGTNNVWAGATYFALAGRDGKVQDAKETLHHLFVRKGLGSMNGITPSDESEAAELKSVIQQVRARKAPSRGSGLMKYLATMRPEVANPVESRGESLSFIPGLPVVPGASYSNASRVFVRENAEEIIAVEIWGAGHAIKIAVFPKDA